ncbi:MAG: aspartyl-phosphate phosphatase Spo0E family protein [Paenibacillus macerans]|nr:aspartyl-phosphate phosphatase Spo0E family protein [Paenibacillus macerans]MDU7476277.1 aspartyl-phosphate phosphatase Spo0E family protein [Paenibacillus macerans]MEC0330960.1 aspartyl-phosphate phosphatase Spo0E family protein [Paenibacillus macerans]
MPENLSRIIATAKKSKGEITLRSVTKDLQAEIERLRREMHELAMREGLNSQLVLQKSVELDKLINLYINSKKDNVWNSA